MAIIRPFRALRPAPAAAAAVAAVPYDVVSTREARRLVADNPLSFLHVSRAEIDLPDSADPYGQAVYERAARNLKALAERAPLVVDPEPALYLYRMQAGGHEQIGLAGCFSLDEYDRDVIKRHERTRRDKEDDRTRHMVALRAQTGIVFLAYRATARLDDAVDEGAAEEVLVEVRRAVEVGDDDRRMAQTLDAEGMTVAPVGGVPPRAAAGVVEGGVVLDELEERAVGVLGVGDEEAEVLVGQLGDLPAAGEGDAHAVIEQVLGESADIVDPKGDVDEVRAVALQEAGGGRVAAHEVGAVPAALEFEELCLVDPTPKEVVVELAGLEHVGNDVRAVEELDDLVHGPPPAAGRLAHSTR